MLVLKLGGAAITDKAQANTPRLDALKRIAMTLAAHPQPLIIVHGAGSFGHIIAKDHALHEGFKDDAQKPALVQLQVQLHALNQIVLAALEDAGVLAMTVHPASMCAMDRRRIAALFVDPVQRILALGMVPVLYGDCVFDRTQTFGILSGDQLVIELANRLGADRVAFGTNVDGVLDSAGQVIPHWTAGTSLSQHQSSAQADVTGGMAGKLAEIAALQQGSACIFNLNDPDQLTQVLAGEVVGTTITPRH